MRSGEPVAAQAGDQRDRLVMAVRDGNAQPPPAASSFARQIGGSAGLIDENKLRGIKIELGGKPLQTLIQHVRALLLFRMDGLF